MDDFDVALNEALVDTFNNILKYEERSIKHLSENPVTVGEAHILEAVNKLGASATVSEIAVLLDVAVPTVTVALKKLEKKGFITKKQSVSDARCYLIELTPSGSKIEKVHNYFHQRMIRNISSKFSPEEKEVLLQAINKLCNFFKDKVYDHES